jgi:hypothetical protein
LIKLREGELTDGDQKLAEIFLIHGFLELFSGEVDEDYLHGMEPVLPHISRGICHGNWLLNLFQ